MNQNKFGFSIACIAAAALLVATPAMGQLVNFPVLALAPGDADGNTSVGAGWGRGLNDQSGKLNLIGAGVVRSMEMVSFGISGGYLLQDAPADNELALAGSLAYHLPVDGAAASDGSILANRSCSFRSACRSPAAPKPAPLW